MMRRSSVMMMMMMKVLIEVNLPLARGQVTLPDIIIGEPNQPTNDLVGSPLTLKELTTTGTFRSEDLEYDPTTTISTSTSRFFEGDIVLNSQDQLYQLLEGDPEGQLSAIRNNELTWPGGVIPYVISASFSSSDRSVIGQAMGQFHIKTCLRFQAKTSAHRDYIHILQGQGCSSAVGRAGGVQVVSLGHGCIHLGVVMHELMHAAGFWHEQSRYDRDNFVTIHWSNIIQGLSYNFDKKTSSVTSDLGLPYDYSSIMHYGPHAFTKTHGQPTISPKKTGVTIGQRKQLSQLDIKGLNLLYRCSGVTPPTTTTTTTTTPTVTCSDQNVHCPSWARAGHCTSNPDYMTIYCKKSCNLCNIEECRDLVGHCVNWVGRGECQRNKSYMTKRCPKACGFCSGGKCSDQHVHCQDWARKGECKVNPEYMNQYCPKACRMC